jgi:hypothetical protein
MAQNARHIAMLKSPRATRRYEACEELRVMPTLPEEARAALQELVHDPDPTVADAALRALQMHADSGTPAPSAHPAPAALPPIGRSDLLLALAGMAVTAASAFVLYAALSLPPALSGGVNLVAALSEVGRFVVMPFSADLEIESFRLAGLLYLVAPSCAIALRARPNARKTVIVVGCISGALYLLAAVVAVIFAGVGQ